MAIIGIFSGAGCQGERVAQLVAERLGYDRIEGRLLQEASAQFGVSEEKLLRAMTGDATLFGRSERDRAKHVSRLQAALAPMLCEDGHVLFGWTSQLLPDTVSHVLRVCIIARHEYRLTQAMETEGLSEKEAKKRIKKSDSENLQWTSYLHNKSPYDATLYDIVIPMDQTPLQEAVTLVCTHAQSDQLQTSPTSTRAAEDCVLAARVRLALAEAGHKVDASASSGRVTILINEYVVRLGHYEDELKRLVQDIPGVCAVETRTGPRFRPPLVNPRADIGGPPKILLVDDEKEYVQTLSDRLKTRDIGTSIVYNGEEALAFIQRDQPDVMILDLQMPGINGIEVLRQVKRDSPEVEVIILTGHGSEREQELAEELGAFAYLTKPVSINDLTQTMKQAYEKGRLTRGGTKEDGG